MCICERNKNIEKRKGAWFLWRERGIGRGKNFCIIGQNAFHYEWKYIEWIDSMSLTSGYLSSKEQEGVGYGANLGMMIIEHKA